MAANQDDSEKIFVSGKIAYNKHEGDSPGEKNCLESPADLTGGTKVPYLTLCVRAVG